MNEGNDGSIWFSVPAQNLGEAFKHTSLHASSSRTRLRKTSVSASELKDDFYRIQKSSDEAFSFRSHLSSAIPATRGSSLEKTPSPCKYVLHPAEAGLDN